MKRLMAYIFTSFFVFLSFDQTVSAPIAHYLQIAYPITVTNNPSPLPLFFKGNFSLIEPEKNSFPPYKALFEFYEEKPLQEIYFLFTPYLAQPQSLEVVQWKTSSDHPYRLFHAVSRPYTGNVLTVNEHDLVNTGTYSAPIKNVSESLFEWVIKELDNSNSVIEIPDNTVVIFTNPNWITVRPILFDSAHPFRILPTVSFIENLETCTFLVKSQEMLFASMEFRAWHKKPARGFCALTNNQTVVMVPAHPKNCRA